MRTDIVGRENITAGREILKLMAAYQRMEDMINIGAYVQGSNPEIDRAIVMRPAINAFLQQDVGEEENFESSMQKLQALSLSDGD